MPPKGKSDPPESTVDTPPADPPAGPDVHTIDADADRLAELERENTELRRKLDEANTARVEAAAAAARADKPAGPQYVFMSEGVRADLEMHGEATDPGTGYLLRRDAETGEVVAYRRGGKEPVEGVRVAHVRELRG